MAVPSRPFTTSTSRPIFESARGGTRVSPLSRWLQWAWCTVWLCCQLK
jgi:hypothetical protein